MGTFHMLGLAKRVGARFLLTSVRSCYDEGKRVAETLTMDYHRDDSVHITTCAITDDQALRKEAMTVYMESKLGAFNVSDLLISLMEGEHIGQSRRVHHVGTCTGKDIEFRNNTEDDPHKRKPDITKAKKLLG
ncbi:hypothetical protein SELMODRAFT_424171 [Selaginella moellendorffii]|uniref:Uncharacterized protein n=1 Tax=Selaginella moellendorffii TaxID=88036 RepID=D8SP19_SELML|nr:hypothetical protein SELMODRAFT_424171 [Selaginella moellendorffii]